MGLDTVEIVLRVEETFGVDLPNVEIELVATVGDLYKLLLSVLDGVSEFFRNLLKAVTIRTSAASLLAQNYLQIA